MPKDLVAIRVKIGLRGGRQAKYPNFNALGAVIQSGLDWSEYIDLHGSGWLYDCCGHHDHEDDSPVGQQWGMLLVPHDFAEQAAAKFPDDVTRLTPAQAEHFYDHCCARDLPDEEIDERVLAPIRLKQEVGQPLTDAQRQALDPNHPARGIRKNHRKRLADLTARRGWRVVD